MTIAAAYLVSDGVVFGADSSTTILVQHGEGPPQTAQILTHSQKVFEVGQDSNLGICTWGSAIINKASHRTIIAKLADKVDKLVTIEEAAKCLVDIVKEVTNVVPPGTPPGIPSGYFLGGTNKVSKLPECYKIEISPECKITPLVMGQCLFAGRLDVFQRIYWGIDPDFAKKLQGKIKENLKEKCPPEFDQMFEQAVRDTHIRFAQEEFAGYPDLPIREAIDFIYSYLHITIKYDKFTYRPPTCGGPIEIGFVTTDRPFRWARHKTFNSAIIEQEGDEYCE